MKTIVLLMDSLNRRYLSVYGGTRVKTPNIDRLADRSCVFENHFVGSAPCMPARHDILTGRLDFLERNWAPVQPFDCTLPQVLRQHGIFSELITDHYHYFHLGGENYFPLFDSWEFIRGQEHDTLAPNLGEPIQKPHYGNYDEQYERNRLLFKEEADYPSPKTFSEATAFLERYHSEDFLLFVDSFDPHEPFDYPDDTPNEYGDRYNDKLFYWPNYGAADAVPEEAVEHARKRYAEVVSMSDRWLGKLLDVMDRYDLWEDTAVFFTTDHGFLLGEKNLLGKNFMPCYNEVYHIPLLVHLPGMTARTHCGALTQNIDLMPTILALHGIPQSACRYPLHGHNLLPLLNKEVQSVRDSVLYGMFGRQVNIFDGRYTYFRSAARADNQPLFLYTAMPSTINHYWDEDHLTDLGAITAGPYLKWTKYPVYRIPGNTTVLADFSHRFTVRDEVVSQNMLFDIQEDPLQEHPIHDEALERNLCEKLVSEMERHDSPEEQFERLGLTPFRTQHTEGGGKNL